MTFEEWAPTNYMALDRSADGHYEAPETVAGAEGWNAALEAAIERCKGLCSYEDLDIPGRLRGLKVDP